MLNNSNNINPLLDSGFEPLNIMGNSISNSIQGTLFFHTIMPILFYFFLKKCVIKAGII